MGLFNTEGSKNELNIGNRVRIKANNREGFITGKEGNYYLVLVNDDTIIEKYEMSELEKCW